MMERANVRDVATGERVAMSFDEIGRRLELPGLTAFRLYHSGLAKLRRQFAEDGLASAPELARCRTSYDGVDFDVRQPASRRPR